MKAQEIRKMTDAEIMQKVKDSKAELLDMRMKQARGALEKPHQMHVLKKDIARMLTVLKEREIKGGNE
jgi:large subunit ribosomal protein L29